ncbi:hypothetical protein COMA2_110016 [Candidatus Nitrospira nitrificans]|uniref:Uncharacterized protein n=1 Tax=Candidatus Nitrospira nitrificans TaxID=1742973 RepID=A0A0S4L788_9BACT|nr:hypothetical protein COMA2_110016 [Candidatus Nitrospira nitrificans]
MYRFRFITNLPPYLIRISSREIFYSKKLLYYRGSPTVLRIFVELSIP